MLAGLCLLMSMPAMAQDRLVFEIPKSSADIGLSLYARQAGRQILFPFDAMSRYQTNAVSGLQSRDEALTLLIRGTGLEAVADEAGTVLIRVNESPENEGSAMLEVKKPSVGLAALVTAMFSGAPSPAVSQSAAGFSIEEIVVTARKRDETLLEIPMAVSVWNEAMLTSSGIQNIEDMYGYIPNLEFSTSGGFFPTSSFTYMAIRGVGWNAGLEPSVGLFVDGMYQPQAGFDIGFSDLARVEILRGPQGTLFGRNAQAGVINLVSNLPNNELEGWAEAEVGQNGKTRVAGKVSGPLTETLFAGVVLDYDKYDGFVSNANSGKDHNYSDRMQVRGTLRWVPNDNIEAVLRIDGGQQDYNGLGLGSPLSCDCYVNYSDQDREDSKNTTGAQLNVDWAFSDSLTLTSITGIREVETTESIDMDSRATGQAIATLSGVPESTTLPPYPLSVQPGPLDVQGATHTTAIDQNFFSQELRLSGIANRVDWQAGAYYFEQEMPQDRLLNLGPGSFDPGAPIYAKEAFRDDRDGWSIFAQASLDVTERTEVTLGARYSEESIASSGERVLNVNDGFIAAFAKDARADFDDFTPNVSATFRVNDTNQLYATWARGWKAGGINRYPSRPGAVQPYDSEESENVEIGLKSSLFGGRLVANIALFDIDIKDQQVVASQPDPDGGPTPVNVISNAPGASSKGAEIEVTAQLSERFLVRISGGTTDTKYKEYIRPDGFDLTGREFIGVPATTGSVILDYGLPLGNEWSFDTTLSYRYVDSYNSISAERGVPVGTLIETPSYDRFDLRATFERRSWKIIGYVNNLADSLDYSKVDYTATINDELYGIQMPSREYGIVVRYTY